MSLSVDTDLMYSFGGLEKDDPQYARFENAAIVCLPVPYGKTASYGKGAEYGPYAILEASEFMELYDEEMRYGVYKYGIYTDHEFSVENMGRLTPLEMVRAVENKIRRFIEANKFVFMIGGDHSPTIGAVHAYAQRYPDLVVVQLDAHADLRESYNGTPFSHACVMRRIIDLCPTVQIGVRSLSQEEADFIKEKDLVVSYFPGSPTFNLNLPRFIRALSNPIYVTIDVDVFDSSLMPSTGTPEPGGFFWKDMLDLLKGLGRYNNIVGFDIMELAPIPNLHAPNFLCAKLAYKFFSYIYKYRVERANHAHGGLIAPSSGQQPWKKAMKIWMKAMKKYINER